MVLTNYQNKIQQAAAILASGFIDDPSFAFIFGEAENKLETLNTFFEMFVTDAMERGEVIFAPEDQGACIWYPAEVEIFNEKFEKIIVEVISLISRFAGLEAGKRYERLIQQVGENEPTANHCEVFFIALKPEARGKGIGENLIIPVLNYADKQQVGCYLVSSNLRNISFYERHGFYKYCPIAISDSYSMTGMWRDFIPQ